MTVREILIDWLKAHGYGGLCGDECGCSLDDLVCCGEDPSQCKSGYRVAANCGACETECCWQGSNKGYCITNKQPGIAA